MSKEKINQLQKWLQEKEVEVAYISDPKHIQYFSGFESDPHERILALFVFANAEPFLFTPALEVTEAKNSPFEGEVLGYQDSEKPFEIIQKAIKNRCPEPKQFAVEKQHLSLERYEALAAFFPTSQFKADLTGFIQQMQLRKTEAEKDIMLEAGHWADVAFEIGFNAIKAGVAEQEIVAEIEYQLKKQGVKEMSFDTLVLAGKNAASPHGNPGSNQIQKNEFVLFDLGVVWKGYCSDATRTVSYHEPTAFQKEIYDIVLEAQLAATKFVKPGVKASEIDKVARDIISSYGYGEYFNHRLGHGIGTTVHEFPSLVEGNDMIIEEGMCFSIEPGIYIPDKVGVRIEDCVYVTKDGCENLTKTSKDLLIIE